MKCDVSFAKPKEAEKKEDLTRNTLTINLETKEVKVNEKLIGYFYDKYKNDGVLRYVDDKGNKGTLQYG